MRIERNYDVKKLILEHDGINQKFGCTYTRVEEPLSREEYLNSEPVIIAFRDLYEVDMLINVLKRFRTELQINMGRWEKQQEEFKHGEC